ncbi:MAG: peptidase M3, partial [Bacteroidales bacterium]|nr:peptidase M3 [Bacteroidales bacterium]
MNKYLLSLFAAGVLVSSCANNESAVNPLLEEWNTPYQIPPFESVKAEHYIPAFKTAMAAHLAEIDQIVNNEAEPTFENTILAYDKSGELL